MQKWLFLLVFLLVGTRLEAFDAVGVMGLLGGSDDISTPPPASTSRLPDPKVGVCSMLIPSKRHFLTPPFRVGFGAAVEGSNSACGASTMLPVKTCEAGAGFLCVNTPDLSVTSETITLRGTIDIKNNILASLTASVQNEYTKEFKQLKFETPDKTSDCRNGSSNYCLDGDGFFSFTMSLGKQFGPYSILVTATRQGEAAAEQKVRTSRVTAPKITNDDVKMITSGDSALVSIDLLHSCQACDFFGISTGGMEITAVNTIKVTDGGVQTIEVKTNSAGGGGIFNICVPTKNGANNIKVSACNAATGFDPKGCPSVNLSSNASTSGGGGLNWLVAPAQFYSADINPTVNLSFTLVDGAEHVKLLFNRNAEQKLTPAPDGSYQLLLDPQTGVNIGVIVTGDKTYPFSFVWGEIVSPFGNSDTWLKSAGGFAISQDFLKNTSRNLLNNFFKSDEFKQLITGLMESADNAPGESDAEDKFREEIAKIKNEIPFCGGGEDEKKYAFKLTKTPQIRQMDIPKIEFKKDAISLVLNAEDIRVWAEAFMDNDEDGEIDKGREKLPLQIGFKKIYSPIDIHVDRSGSGLKFLLTGPSTDCEYKSKGACDGFPAILVPKDFLGSITKWGKFVKCDEDVDKDCNGVNAIDKQTGLISMTVLDAINKKLYCDGSATLTYILREWMKDMPIQIGCVPEGSYPKKPLIKLGTCSGVFAEHGWIIPAGIDLLGNQFNVDEKGIWGIVPATVGSEAFYADMPGELKKPGVGFIKRPFLSSSPSIASSSALSGGYDFGIAVSEDFLNALLFVLTEQSTKGILDWEIHEPLLKKMGFDPVKECNEFKPKTTEDRPSVLCQLLPRVGNMLGNTLVTNGYFSQNQPLMMRLSANRQTPPRISFFTNGGRQYIDLQINDAGLAFYALQVDESVPADQYGNLTLKLDANGNPIIKSMNPNDPNPENGQIIKLNLSVILALEISDMMTDPDDPSRMAITIRPEQSLTKIVYKPVAGGNATVIPDESLISAFEEKLNYGVNIYSDPAKAIKISLPKEVNFAENINLETLPFGLGGISFGKDGIKIGVEDSQEYIDILARLVFTQFLTVDGTHATFTIPE